LLGFRRAACHHATALLQAGSERARRTRIAPRLNNPLRNGGLLKEWVMKDGKRVDGDERLMYLPMAAAGGTSIELFWEYPNGAVIYRDDTWPSEARPDPSGPRLDFTTVMSANLPNTTKVYTETLGLDTLSLTQGLSRDWIGVGEQSHAWVKTNGSIWVELVAPSGEAGKKALADSKLGDGALVELGVEVSDIDAFHDAMAAKGIKMTAGDGIASHRVIATATSHSTRARACGFWCSNAAPPQPACSRDATWSPPTSPPRRTITGSWRSQRAPGSIFIGSGLKG
jgi:hypothetical protein